MVLTTAHSTYLSLVQQPTTSSFVSAVTSWSAVAVTLCSLVLQAHAPDVRLWVACMDLNYQALMAEVMQQNQGMTFQQVREVVP